MYHYILVLLVIGIFILLHSLFSKSEAKRSNDPESIKTIEEKTATLARLINAISIQNEINSGSVTMKEVLAEALDVRNATLFDIINEKDISDAVKAVKTVGSITDRPAQIIKETTETLDKVLLLGNSILQTFSISQMFSSLSGFNIDLSSIESDIPELIENLEVIAQEIESSNPNKEMTVEHYSGFSWSFEHLHNKNLPDLKKEHNKIKDIEKTLGGLNSLVVDIEKYQLLTNETF
uniref:WSN domain-containing protein n=1 Tax=Caenorhabditis japonica TaxID=281687 RepID=A0A8R1EEQ5_CAEJA